MTHGDLENFITWEPVQNTMFHLAKPAELEYLKSTKDWPIWEKAITETPVGNPPNNLNLIHQAYSLARYLEYYNGIGELKNIQSIVEIGGGYGCMRRLIHELGFRGTYTIFDFPEFIALQKYYLDQNNIPTKFTTKPEELIADFYIALWSVSEMPLDQRDAVLQNAHRYLIAFQKEFEGIDNEAYFIKFMNRDGGWRKLIEHLPGSIYLMR